MNAEQEALRAWEDRYEDHLLDFPEHHGEITRMEDGRYALECVDAGGRG